MKRFLLLSALCCCILFLPALTFQEIKGRKETKWLTSKNGARVRKEEYKEFNTQGHLVKWIQYFDKGEICEVFEIQYQGNRRLKEIRKYCNGTGSTSKVFKYDQVGRPASEDWYNEKVKLTNIRVFLYDGAENQPTGYEDLDPKDKHPNYSAKFEYYPSGLLKKETQFADEDWYGTRTYTYDNDGRLNYKTEEVDGGVGLVQTYYIYKNGQLYQDSVVVPDEATEYHLYEIEN